MSTPELNAVPSRSFPGFRLITDLLVGGGTTLLVGLVFLLVSPVFALFVIPGIVCATVGFALVVVAAVVYPFIKRFAPAH